MITNQAHLFIIFIINGIIIGLLFDFFRILRKTIKTADFITYIEDIIFWILTGFIILYSVFMFNNGEIRFYMFLAILIGIVAYMCLFSKYFININVFIINKVKEAIIIITRFIIIPFKFLYKLIRKIFFKPISFCFINLKKFSTKISKKYIVSNKKMLKIEKKRRIF